MVRILGLKADESILEPACGDGAFVEALIGTGLPLEIFCLDKNPVAIKAVRAKFGASVQSHCVDTILDPLTGPNSALAGGRFPRYFDRIIGNPPYGGWLDHETRAYLKKKFPGFHVRETYSLFLLKALDLLRPGGVLSFIIPDTFLTVASHRPLRDLLLRRTEIIEVLTLPSKLFPGVAFGYSNLCIITLRLPNEWPNSSHEIRFTSVATTQELEGLSKLHNSEGVVTKVIQRSLLEQPSKQLWISHESEFDALVKSSSLTLGMLAECKTGIYTGDNKTFIHSIDGVAVRGDYQTISPEMICTRDLSEAEKYTGVTDQSSWLPIVKGGSHRFTQPLTWAINWSPEAIMFYKTDKKARFQNSQFYFRQGIGVPMVTSRRINAFLTENRVFDQSVVGIFPKDSNWLFPLLVILNSSFATKLLKQVINPTANNSANYLKRLPLPEISKSEMNRLTMLGKLIVERRHAGNSTEVQEAEANSLIESYYRRASASTKQDTLSNHYPINADTPMFPCLT